MPRFTQACMCILLKYQANYPIWLTRQKTISQQSFENTNALKLTQSLPSVSCQSYFLYSMDVGILAVENLFHFPLHCHWVLARIITGGSEVEYGRRLRKVKVFSGSA